MRKRIQDFNISFGQYPRGKHNALTDVPGVQLGQVTACLEDPFKARTGITAIIPGDGDLIDRPIAAASSVINGYGKSAGLIQLEELGCLETPILLTNTMNVGRAADALIDFMLTVQPDCRSINPLVLECNDGLLNDIRKHRIQACQVHEALARAQAGPIETGSVGAGTGMVCYGYKGGIGTASRRVTLDDVPYTIGVLVLSNFGKPSELTIKNQLIRPYYPETDQNTQAGSIIVVIGTDIPMTYRQLRRLTHRAAFGIARTGGRCHHSSGEVIVAFSNAGRVSLEHSDDIITRQVIVEKKHVINALFDCVIDCVEESIIDSLFTAETTTGYQGMTIPELPVSRLLKDYQLSTSQTALETDR